MQQVQGATTPGWSRVTEATQDVFLKREQDMTDCLIGLTLRKKLKNDILESCWRVWEELGQRSEGSEADKNNE